MASSPTSPPVPDGMNCPLTQVAHHGMAKRFEEQGSKEGFEGAEKRLEMDFRGEGDMRLATREFWDGVMEKIKAKIVDILDNGQLRSHLLTESSLFVASHRVTVITCGTTQLLAGLPLIVEEAGKQGLEVEWASYSRKNFLFPWAQPSPHSSHTEEMLLLKKFFPEGHCFLLGPLDADHYFVFNYDRIERPREEKDQQLNIIMYDLDPEIAKLFGGPEDSINSPASEQLRKNTKLDKLFEGMQVQDMVFEPCGYSANCLGKDTMDYFTIHVTPEAHCSYASFETCRQDASYRGLIEQVLSIFRPGRFTTMMFVDELSNIGQTRRKGEDYGSSSFEGYTVANTTTNEFEPQYKSIKNNYVRSKPVEK